MSRDGWPSSELEAHDCYTERPPRPELRRHVSCVWFERARQDGTPSRTRVLPDGYVDLVFGRSLWVRGPDTRSHAVGYGPESAFVGVRFRTGAAPAVLGVPTTELVDRRVFLRDVWGREADHLAERFSGLPLTNVAAELEAALLARLRPPDPFVESVVASLRRDLRQPIRALAEGLGVSERQLLRRSKSALGYGPKTLQRILRLQRFLGLAAGRAGSLVELAFAAGYADQPHLTRECRRLTGRPPSTFVR